MGIVREISCLHNWMCMSGAIWHRGLVFNDNAPHNLKRLKIPWTIDLSCSRFSRSVGKRPKVTTRVTCHVAVFRKQNSKLPTHAVCSRRIRRRSIRVFDRLHTQKNTLLRYQAFFSRNKAQRIISDVICAALYVRTQNLIHAKCHTLLKGTFQQTNKKCSYQRPPVWSTVREHPALCSLSLHSSVRGECLGGWGGCVGALEPLATGHCQVGSSAGAEPRAHQECGRLISCKGARDAERKANVSVGRRRRVPARVFLLQAPGWQI